MADTKPMTFHLPVDLKARLERIAVTNDRSLTKQMIAMLKAQADAEEKRVA
jgi:predicted transcriptional regulator